MSEATGERVQREACPRCRQYTIVYNGNYWCDNPNCSWVMGERGRANHRIIVAYLGQRWLEAKDAGDTETMTRMEFYLEKKVLGDA